MHPSLTFENIPPFSAPLRFFLTGPLFAALAGVLLLVEGPAMFVSRWSPQSLAATHLLSVGCMLQIMLGALIQVLPVVAGVSLAQPLRVARLVHAGLTFGTLLLVAGFYFGLPQLLSLGAGLLVLDVLYFLALSGRALYAVPSTSPTIRGLKLALFSLSVLVALGGVMALGMAHGINLPLPELTDLHAAWGLAGWAGVLLAAMAYVVVPMFQLTPGYPARSGWFFPVFIVAVLLLWSGAVWLDLLSLIPPSQALLALAGLAFAWQTWRLQGQRRRARADTTYRYWQLGLAASILALLMLLAAVFLPSLAESASWPLAFGILLMAGGFLPFISGMLYKIVPFLAWLHLQNQGQAKVPAPNMNRILADTEMQKQFQLYALAVALLLAAAFFPDWLARPAGLVFALANGGLTFNLLVARRRYRRYAVDMRDKLVLAP